MTEQIGWRGLVDRLKAEAPHYNKLLPQLPRMVHQALVQIAQPKDDNQRLLVALLAEQRRTNRLISTVVYFSVGLIGGLVLVRLLGRWLIWSF
jgi:ubiquinone biosynthesis protein